MRSSHLYLPTLEEAPADAGINFFSAGSLQTTISQRFFDETLYRIKSMPAGLTLIFRNWCIGTSIIFSAVVGIIKTADKYGYPLHAVRISKTHFNLVCRLWPECKLEKSIRAFLCLFLRTCRESV